VTPIKEEATGESKPLIMKRILRLAGKEVLINRDWNETHMSNKFTPSDFLPLGSKDQVVDREKNHYREHNKDGNHGFTS
jgi:hypothetical protein